MRSLSAEGSLPIFTPVRMLSSDGTKEKRLADVTRNVLSAS